MDQPAKVSPLPCPQTKNGETSQSIKLREPMVRWQLLFSRRFNETPRARHAPLTSCSPSKPDHPLCVIGLFIVTLVHGISLIVSSLFLLFLGHYFWDNLSFRLFEFFNISTKGVKRLSSEPVAEHRALRLCVVLRETRLGRWSPQLYRRRH